MILMLQIFDVTANENARYKRNELEFWFESYDQGSSLSKLGQTSRSRSKIM